MGNMLDNLSDKEIESYLAKRKAERDAKKYAKTGLLKYSDDIKNLKARCKKLNSGRVVVDISIPPVELKCSVYMEDDDPMIDMLNAKLSPVAQKNEINRFILDAIVEYTDDRNLENLPQVQSIFKSMLVERDLIQEASFKIARECDMDEDFFYDRYILCIPN